MPEYFVSIEYNTTFPTRFHEKVEANSEDEAMDKARDMIEEDGDRYLREGWTDFLRGHAYKVT